MNKYFKKIIFLFSVVYFLLSIFIFTANFSFANQSGDKVYSIINGQYTGGYWLWEIADDGSGFGWRAYNVSGSRQGSWLPSEDPPADSTATPPSSSNNIVSYSGGEAVTILGKNINTGSLNGFAEIAIAISNLILGLVGSLALLFFIYGGVMFLISSGSQERVTQAKQIIVGAVIGIVIVFTSYMIINFVAVALGVVEPGGSILQSDWFK